MALSALNRRHKALLFLTLVAAGLSLLFGADAKQTAGVVLLGLATTWVLGGLSPRTIGLSTSILALLAGVSIAGLPVLLGWTSFRSETRSYNSAISDLTDAIRRSPLLPLSPPSSRFGQEVRFEVWPTEGNVLKAEGPPWKLVLQSRSQDIVTDKNGNEVGSWVSGDRIVDVPSSVRDWEGPWSSYVGDSTPGFIPDSVSVVVFPRVSDQAILGEIETQLLRPKPTFSAWSSLRKSWLRSVGGLALALFGLIGLALLRSELWLRRSTRSLRR